MSRGFGRALAALAIFAVVFSVLCVASYTRRSGTWDEPVHLTTGYAALAEGDYRVEPTHPPFIRMWSALPLLFMDDIRFDAAPIDRMAPIDWHSDEPAYDFSSKFLYVDNDADRLLNAARFMIVILGIVLGVLLFCWAHEWLGFGAAVAALAFYALSPMVQAHSALVTTDIGVACFIFGTIYFLWRTVRQTTRVNVGGLAVFFALAVVSKFSALILGPIVAILLGAAVWRRTMPWRTAVALVALLTVASYVAVWAVYGFQYAPSRNPEWVLHLENAPLARTVPTVAAVTRWIDAHRLLPNMFTEGFLMFAQSMRPPVRTYLAGDYSDDGWWYYYPAAFVMKAPLPFIALLIVGIVVEVRQRRELGGFNLAFVVLPVAIYLTAGMVNTYQVGLRHMLPLYPFMMMTAAAGAVVLARQRIGRYALGALAAFWLIVFVDVYPHTLTFFNRAVGGPENGPRYLADSNIDWGQGLKVLKEWMDEQGIGHIGLAYYGTADPAYYGIDYTPLPAATQGFELPSIHRPWGRPPLPGYVAISATVLTGAYNTTRWRIFYSGLRDLEPAAVLGNSIYVYRLDRWPEPIEAETPEEVAAERLLADDLLRGSWYTRAIFHYRRYLEHRPDDAAAVINLGTALVTSGASAEAVPVLRRGVELAPRNGVAHVMLAAALFDTRGDIDELLDHARLAASLLPRDAYALVTLSRALAVSGDVREALDTVDRALEIDPDDPEALRLRQVIRTVVDSPA